MTVLAIIVDEEDAQFALDLEERYPVNYHVQSRVWLVATNDLTKEVSSKLFFDGGKDKSDARIKHVVLSTNGYWGYANNDLWEFMARNA